MITIQVDPEGWAPRGSKIYAIAISDEVGNAGFKYGVRVVDNATGKQYEFLIDPHPTDQRLYFEMNSIIRLQHEEQNIDPHYMPASAPTQEPQGKGWNSYLIYISEWWIVSQELVQNPGSEEQTTASIFNGYFQQINGFMPDVESGSTDVRLAANSSVNSRAFTDRFRDTHQWYNYAVAIGSISTCIPAYMDDYGSVAFQTRLTAMKTNNIADVWYKIAYGSAGSVSETAAGIIPLPAGAPIAYVGIYPANLNDDTSGLPRPVDYPDWICIRFVGRDASGTQCTNQYLIYNAERYGQVDCKYDRVRLAWVNSRGGYDYFNFIKKNEYSNKIDRKQYVRNIFNGSSSVFSKNSRQMMDRNNIVSRTLNIISDWIQENEFIFLRSLLVSNQVSIISDSGITIPVSIDDSNYIEKKGRDGKLVNLSLTLNISYDYWT